MKKLIVYLFLLTNLVFGGDYKEALKILEGNDGKGF